MTLLEFQNTLNAAAPPAVDSLLQALWHDARGDWDRAHKIAQDIPSSNGSWVHAYLHRKEGDIGNARYWYNRAGKPQSHQSLEEEWKSIATALLT